MLTSISDARNRARIAANQRFEQSIRSSISDCSVAFYNFEGSSNTTVREAGGSGPDGTINGDPQRVDSVNGLGQAMEFDGSDDYVGLGDNLIDNYSELTVSMWVNPSSLTGSGGANHGAVFNKSGSSDDNIGFQLVNPSNASFYLDLNSNDSITADAPRLNQWTNITLTYDGGEMKIYSDGEQKASRTVSGNIIENTNHLKIGARADSGLYYEGKVDSIRIYNCAFTSA